MNPLTAAHPTPPAEAPPRSGGLSPLNLYVAGVCVLSALVTALLLRADPPHLHEAMYPLKVAVALLIVHVLNQLNFTIRFSGQPDNVEITFSEAGLVALFFKFVPGVVALMCGLAHLVRELQAHRRRRVQVVFNIGGLVLSVACAGWVYHAMMLRFGGPALHSEHRVVPAMMAAMVVHSLVNRLLVGAVLSFSAGQLHFRYFKSLFIENLVMLLANMAVGMTAVLAMMLDGWLLWVPATILGVVYLGYQAYVVELRDANTFARLYQNALLAGIETESSLVPLALAKAMDTFSTRDVSLVMGEGSDTLEEWRMIKEGPPPMPARRAGALRDLPGAETPCLLATHDAGHARAWRAGSKNTGMAAPVMFEGQLMGVLRAEKPRAWDAFTSGDLRAFSLFARQLGVTLENARLQELDREQQHLRQRLLANERNRISRDLHDSFVQTLVNVDLHVAYLQKLVEKRPDDVPKALEELQGNVREGLAEARSYMSELKPLRIAPGEFAGTAQRYLTDFGRQNRLQTILQTEWDGRGLAPEDLTELFQIVREALNNVAKHAKAQSVRVRITSDDTHITTTVADDGVGFQADAAGRQRGDGHYGLSNIVERATGLNGAVDWDSAPGEGTTMTLTVPRRAATAPLKGATA